jgi:uncharacterized protein (DUF433 family)
VLLLFVIDSPKAIQGWNSMNAQLARISIDPEICGGKPCIKGTRIWVSLILDNLADGMTEAELFAEYPQLTHDDVLAAMAYGAEASRERFVAVPA